MILFDWNDEKAARNQRKHGITFADATQVFDGPFALASRTAQKAAKGAGRPSAWLKEW